LENITFEKESVLSKSRQAAVSQMELYSNRRVHASFLPGRLHRSISHNPEQISFRVILESNDENHNSFTVTNGAAEFGATEITAREIAMMGVGAEHRLLIFGNSSASNELKKMQELTMKFQDNPDDIPFADIEYAVKNNVDFSIIKNQEALKNKAIINPSDSDDVANVTLPLNRPRF